MTATMPWCSALPAPVRNALQHHWEPTGNFSKQVQLNRATEAAKKLPGKALELLENVN